MLSPHTEAKIQKKKKKNNNQPYLKKTYFLRHYFIICDVNPPENWVNDNGWYSSDSHCSSADKFTSRMLLRGCGFSYSYAMGITCTSHYLPQSLQEPSPLSSKLYKPFPRKKRCTRSAVIMQLTGEGLASSNPPRFMNELVTSVRYHYQYQCLFPAQDDSVLIYGEKWNTLLTPPLTLSKA